MSEIHVFVLWSHAAPKETEILADISENFEIVAMYRIRWDMELFARNLSRFYGRKLPAGSDKQAHCGSGPLTVIVVRNSEPMHGIRDTTSGPALVDARVFEAKERYRQWTGGGHRVHSSNTVSEARHDLALLLGTEAAQFFSDEVQRWDGNVVEIDRDVAGAHGWASFRELFFVLNHTSEYVVLRNFESLSDDAGASPQGDLDLLVNDYYDAVAIANGRPVFVEPFRVHHEVDVGGIAVPFDLRYVGDDYFDAVWQRTVLADRIPDAGGFYRPTPTHYFYTLLYHALVHKQAISAEYGEKLSAIAESVGLKAATPELLFDESHARSILDRYLNDNGYRYVRPYDLSVTYREFRACPLPLDRPEATVISCELIAEANGFSYWCREYVQGGLLRRQMSLDLAEREAHFLRELNPSPWFPTVRASGSEDGYSWVELEAGDSLPLHEGRWDLIKAPDRLAAFFGEALKMLHRLREHEVVHRDIRKENLRVSVGHPLLVGFGFAVDGSRLTVTPPRLGGIGRPPEGTFSDVYALGKVFAYLDPGDDPLLGQAIRLMTEADPSLRLTDLASVSELFASLTRDDEIAKAARVLLENIALRDEALRRRLTETPDDQLGLLTRDLEEIVGSTPFILVDDDQLRSELPARLHPVPYLERGGKFWGPPSDDVHGISELERMRKSGASNIAFSWPAFWWLDHYQGLAKYLRERFPCVMRNDRVVVFDLAPSSTAR